MMRSTDFTVIWRELASVSVIGTTGATSGVTGAAVVVVVPVVAVDGDAAGSAEPDDPQPTRTNVPTTAAKAKRRTLGDVVGPPMEAQC
jgi:hypothetical protein